MNVVAKLMKAVALREYERHRGRYAVNHSADADHEVEEEDGVPPEYVRGTSGSGDEGGRDDGVGVAGPCFRVEGGGGGREDT